MLKLQRMSEEVEPEEALILIREICQSNQVVRLVPKQILELGGNIEIFGLDTLNINNGNVSVSTQTGQAGDLNVEASKLVQISGENSSLAAQANQKGGVAGNINVYSREVVVENGASISASNVDDSNRRRC